MLPFDYARPQTLAETTELLSQHGTAARMLAGGTDLIVGLRHGIIRPGIVVDLKRIVDLPRTITHTPEHTMVGAGVTMAELAVDPQVKLRFPALVEAANTVGSIQIRNRATLAGNVCNASPAADTAPALLIHGAAVTLTGSAGERTLPLTDFVLGPRRTALEPDELLTAIQLPVPAGPLGTSFARMTRRRGVDLATINLCCSVDSAGITTFAYGAVAPRPFTVIDDTGVLADPATPAAARDQVLRTLIDQARPITDVRASREYRLAMLLVMSRRTLRTAIERLPERN